MKKYIDANKIEQIICDGTIDYPNKSVRARVVPVIPLRRLVDYNAEDVIRCRDCRYFQTTSDYLKMIYSPVRKCFYGGYWMPSDFCSKAERKGDNYDS